MKFRGKINQSHYQIVIFSLLIACQNDPTIHIVSAKYFGYGPNRIHIVSMKFWLCPKMINCIFLKHIQTEEHMFLLHKNFTYLCVLLHESRYLQSLSKAQLISRILYGFYLGHNQNFADTIWIFEPLGQAINNEKITI